MSVLYEEYKKLKAVDQNKYYLFRSGNFYIFLGEDADRINQYVVLKRTAFCKETIKCGFPVKSLEDYLKVFQNHGLEVLVIEKKDHNDVNALIKKIKDLDLDTTTPRMALNILKELKDCV